MNGADGFIGNGVLACSCKTGDSEVGDFDGSVFKKHYILGFYIAVNDSLIMCVLESAKNLNGKMNSFFPAENFLLFNILFKSYAVDVLHNDILNIFVEAYVINFYDVRMRKNRYRFGFIAEAAEKFIVFHMLIPENFYRNNAVINAVICFIYVGHSAYADNFLYLIAAVKFFTNISVHQEPPRLSCDTDNGDVVRSARFFCGTDKFIRTF